MRGKIIEIKIQKYTNWNFWKIVIIFKFNKIIFNKNIAD